MQAPRQARRLSANRLVKSAATGYRPACSRAPIRPPSQAPRPPPRRRFRPGRDRFYLGFHRWTGVRPVKGLDRLVDQRLDGGGKATRARARPRRSIDHGTRHRTGPVSPQKLIEPRPPDPKFPARLHDLRAIEPLLAGQSTQHEFPRHRPHSRRPRPPWFVASVRHREASPPSNSTEWLQEFQ